ncbi:immunoglobulin kappa light chain-like isoform X2 [Cetorhinus maximus]
MNVGNIKLQISKGDITKEATDVIVNSTSNTPPRNGVSHAIATASKLHFEHKLQSADLKFGKILLTGPGKLKCKKIMHVCGHDDLNGIQMATESVLRECIKMSFESVAFPAIGTGSGKLHPSLVARMMTDVIASIAQDFPSGPLQLVCIVVSDRFIFNSFTDALAKRLQEASAASTLNGVSPTPVLQQPLSASVPKGGTAALSCRVENLNVGDYGGIWYRRRGAQRPEYVLVHWASGSIERAKGITERYLPSRDTKTNSYILTISSIVEADTGAYYCAVSHSNQLHFGTGVQLLIPSRQLSAPTVHLYPPPADQLTRDNVTLSCLADGFYPGYVRARWTLDGVEAESELWASAAEAAPAKDGSYSWSGYLTLPAGQWGAHSRFSCQLQHESSPEPIASTIEREACQLQ